MLFLLHYDRYDIDPLFLEGGALMVKPSALKPYFKSIGRCVSMFIFIISHRHSHL